MFFPILGLGGAGTALNLVHHVGTKRENLTALPIRAAVLEAVAAHPGIIFSQLRELLGCSPGTLQHHLNLLERERFLASVQAGRRRRLFLAGTPPEARAETDLLQTDQAWSLVRSVMDNPGIIQKEIAASMAMSRKMLRAYLNQLSQHGLVREVPAGRFRSYYPSEGLLGLMADPKVREGLAGLPERSLPRLPTFPRKGPGEAGDLPRR